MVPKAHSFPVDDQVMLHLLRLGSQLIILCDGDIKRSARVGVASAARTLAIEGFLNRAPERPKRP
jgi:hypothetical protein